ncbi:uncharacterized protein LOC107043444 [Diachasma alloeum]|uniref:uncharacterized protein LOC107043444 n=1 Tax=Diachasma alloeum TaxID=454923 RepID=UPI0007384DD2|nr:uncharacterized protein LOC107043444 [Diachasma alloeum]
MREAFLAGLRRDIKNMMFPLTPTSFDEAVGVAVTIESKLKETEDFEQLRKLHAKTKQFQGQAKIRATESIDDDALEADLRALDIKATNSAKADGQRRGFQSGKGNSDYKRGKQNDKREKKPNTADYSCYKCSKPGHFARECRTPSHLIKKQFPRKMASEEIKGEGQQENPAVASPSNKNLN